MSHVFISYSRKNSDIVLEIVDALNKRNIKTWIDTDDMAKGEDWKQELFRAIESADAFLFFISEASVRSDPCNDEILHAIQNSKRILPVFIENVPDEDFHLITDRFSDQNQSQKNEICRRDYIK